MRYFFTMAFGQPLTLASTYGLMPIADSVADAEMACRANEGVIL